MGEVKKNLLIIFLSLILGLNFVLAQSGFYSESEYIPFLNIYGVYCDEIYIENFFYGKDNNGYCGGDFYSNYSSSSTAPFYARVSRPQYNYFVYSAPSTFLKVKAYSFSFNYTAPFIELYPDNTDYSNLPSKITKIYVFKNNVNSLLYPAGYKFYAKYPDDLVAVIDDLDFRFYENYFGQLRYRDFSGANNLRFENLSRIIEVDRRTDATGWFPREDFVFIAEGVKEDGSPFRRVISFFNQSSDKVFKFITLNELALEIENPSGAINLDYYDNILKFKLYRTDEFSTTSQLFLRLIDNKTGRELWNSLYFTVNITNPPSGQTITINLNDYGINFKDVLIDLRNNNKNDLTFYLSAKLLNPSGVEFIIYNKTLLYLIGGFSPISYTYEDWYNDVIGSFGLSGATPTPIFVKAGEFIDKTFYVFQSFITIDNEKLNNLKSSIISTLNTLIAYVNGFTGALGFLKYLFYGLLVFTIIEFIIKFGRLIIPFK
jgi:hypothetical protein